MFFQVSQKFYQNFDFPNVYGALDCTLIKLESPGGNLAERFRSCKVFFALNVQTLSDSDLYIRNLVVQWPGNTHGTTVFDNSYLGSELELQVPKRYHVLGDIPLQSYLLTSFLNPANASQIRNNAAPIRARNVLERQYGVWKKRFFSIGSALRCYLENAQTIIAATAVFHNVAISQNDVYEEADLPQDGNDIVKRDVMMDGVTKRNAIVSTYF